MYLIFYEIQIQILLQKHKITVALKRWGFILKQSGAEAELTGSGSRLLLSCCVAWVQPERMLRTGAGNRLREVMGN